MTGPNWQADMMNRLDDTAAAGPVPPAAAEGTQPSGNAVEEPVAPVSAPAPPGQAAPVVGEPTMPPPPPPAGEGWGAPVPPQEQQPQYQQYQQQPGYQQGQAPYQQYQGQPQQYQQAPYQQQGYQQPYQQYPQQQPPPYQQAPYQEPQYQQQPYPPYPPQPPYEQPHPQQPPYEQPQGQQPPYEQGYQQPYPQQPQYQEPQPPQYQEPQQPQYAPPPPQPPYPQQPQQYPQAPYQEPQYQQQPPAQQYGPPPQQSYGPPPQQQQGWNQPPAGDGSWNAPPQQQTGWDNPTPDGPNEHAYTPAYHDPLGEPLPVATGSVGLQHQEERPGPGGGFLRRIGRFAAEAAYIAGASGRMQRDVENIALIRRPIGIGRMIGVIGPVPQSGTSIVTALLADTLAAQRTDIVLAVDACPQEGKLSHRLDQGIASTPNSRVQLARAEPTAEAISDVLAARNVGGANQIPLSLVDCPAGLYEEATGYVAGAAHAVALVIPSSRDGALTSIDQLDRLSADGQHMLVEKGLVIIAENHPDDPEPVQWLQSAVSDRGLGYVVLPYDAHLARAWPLRPEALEPATRRAALELAARLVERATR